jgi:stage V sporulation protein G
MLGEVVISLEVTDVRVRKVLMEGKMKAIVSVTLDDSFVIHDVKVVEGHNGLFVAMPSRKTPDGEFRDIAHPITSSARELIQTAVLNAYGEVI